MWGLAPFRLRGFWGQVCAEVPAWLSLPGPVTPGDVGLGQQVPSCLAGWQGHTPPRAPSCWDVPPGTAGDPAAITVTVGCETEHLSSPACILYYIYYIILYLLDYIILYYIIRAVRPSTPRLEPSAPQLLG